MAGALIQQLEDTTRAIRAKTPEAPAIGVILGTGLTKLLREVRESHVIPYADLPHMPRSTAPGHHGRLVFGELAGKSVVVMDGRFHLYEGYTAGDVTYPVRVLREIGVNTLLISNVAGGLNPQFTIGDLMLIADHINLLGASPLTGPNDERLGPRFPDMSRPYDLKLMELARGVAKTERVPLREGVYVAMPGPQLETRAEYRWVRQMGADAVGMSTVPEVIAAVHGGLRVMAVSLISDLCIPETLKPVAIEEILAVADRSEPLLTKLFLNVVKQLPV